MCEKCNAIVDLVNIIDEKKTRQTSYHEIIMYLSKQEELNNIILYAARCNFLESLELCTFDDNIQHYFYCNQCKQGFHLYLNRTGFGLRIDNEIFRFSHRYLYNKNHLNGKTGTFFKK